MNVSLPGEMSKSFSIFRILGDLSHFASKVIIILAIHRNQSTEGVSLITQALYCLVFVSRYLDIFLWNTIWNTALKFFYVLSSLYILFLMLRVFSRTREREKAWKLGAVCLAASAVGAPIIMSIFTSSIKWSWRELFWTFSIILESICILPQLVLLRQTTVPTVIDSYYLLTLGSYRAFYILNWIWRELDITDRKPDAISIIFGILQTAFYVDFAWIYYSRQRVKLRHGGIVDADDLHNGWLLRTIFGNKVVASDEESTPTGRDENRSRSLPKTGSKWGSRGISVSADENLLDDTEDGDFEDHEESTLDAGSGSSDLEIAVDTRMKDPDEMAKILDEDGDEDISDGHGPQISHPDSSGVWREGNSRL
ncbi:BgTH12-00760 [Blumeria graminis f. sp. triticale]|uniref:Bgt-5458 n=3 Tax=Blumeria graminis TaxID=34373 RepID=A0A9X9QFH8_BLUGR|nr:HDEL receptor [Blumeria graminis f. sp. tritici 96224]CAD6505268.1 BgTH12-00760 [Blumeria graminis f. sp. triticale]VDB93276.1 Bgt-5458 [Blumeria graminis f. sp. tritici]